MGAILPLVRRWVVDWLCGHDPSVLPDLLDEDYQLTIGSLAIRGRAAYEEAVMGQLRQFPGLGLTVHEVMATENQAAVRFTEHGASTAHGGRVAAWGGIVLFRSEGGRLSLSIAEEDYAARRRQLRSGVPDVVEPPHPAPWDTPVEAPDPAAEWVVSEWLRAGLRPHAPEVLVDDQAHGQSPEPVLLTGSPRIDELFSAGSRVAFHLTQAEAGPGEGDGSPLRLAGIVTVRDGTVAGGRLVRDRLGAQRRPART